MAADFLTRAWALAIATAACVGLPAALVYAVVRVAAARHLGAAVALAAFLAVWVAVSAAYYPRAFADIVRWFALARCLRGHRARHTTTRRALLPRFVAAARSSQQQQGNGDVTAAAPREVADVRGGARGFSDDDDVLALWNDERWFSNDALVPPIVARSRLEAEEDGGDMAALPREPPAARDERRRDGGEVWDSRCVVCLCDVEEVETAKSLPVCLHVFHRHCIDRWLHDHSTCPICRRNALAAGAETL